MAKHNDTLHTWHKSSLRNTAIGLFAGLGVLASLSGCDSSDDDDQDKGGTGEFAHVYASASITWVDDNNISYISLLPNLESKKVELDDAIEYPGWAGVYAHGGKLFVSDGEKPTLKRYSIDGSGKLKEEAAISFMAYGADDASVAFVADDKGYLFANKGVVWSADSMEVTGTFDVPEIEDRDDGLEFSGLSVGRSFASYGKRAYVATNWANWDTYRVSEDSLIVVIDTEKNEVVKTIPAPCPYLDVATVDDDGYVYFSNWTYSISQTLLEDKKKACAVRIAPGKDELDDSWSLTFADVTDGHEGGVLRYAGNGKAVFVAYYQDRIEGELKEESPGALADLANWKLWMVDLKTLEANPVEGLDWTSGGYYLSRVGDQTFVLAPNDDYTSTTFYELSADGKAESRFDVDGWSLDIVQVR